MRDYSALDAEALIAISDPIDWAYTVLNKAIAQYDPYPEWVIAMQERVERMDAAALTAVREALGGKVPVDTLGYDGHELFYDFFPYVGPHPEANKFYAAMRELGGDVRHEKSRMALSPPEGKAEVVKDSAADE
ncbi:MULTISPECIES: hypothetical protein [Novilysobacter]|uniref:hypothetical protein n=1 Tax=Novilysobacter TaxID=3382699 RepID=UPI002ED8DF22